MLNTVMIVLMTFNTAIAYMTIGSEADACGATSGLNTLIVPDSSHLKCLEGNVNILYHIYVLRNTSG